MQTATADFTHRAPAARRYRRSAGFVHTLPQFFRSAYKRYRRSAHDDARAGVRGNGASPDSLPRTHGTVVFCYRSASPPVRSTAAERTVTGVVTTIPASAQTGARRSRQRRRARRASSRLRSDAPNLPAPGPPRRSGTGTTAAAVIALIIAAVAKSVTIAVAIGTINAVTVAAIGKRQRGDAIAAVDGVRQERRSRRGARRRRRRATRGRTPVRARRSRSEQNERDRAVSTTRPLDAVRPMRRPSSPGCRAAGPCRRGCR